MRENNHSVVNLIEDIKKENKKIDSPPIRTKYQDSAVTANRKKEQKETRDQREQRD